MNQRHALRFQEKRQKKRIPKTFSSPKIEILAIFEPLIVIANIMFVNSYYNVRIFYIEIKLSVDQKCIQTIGYSVPKQFLFKET